MMVDGFPNKAPVLSADNRRSKRDTQQAQEIIYNFFISIVKTLPSAEVLSEFKRLFVSCAETTSSNELVALYEIIFANQEKEFQYTIKRSCYILINNWEMAREYEAIQQLVLLFEDPVIHRSTVSPTLRRLRTWLANFVASKDYQDLKLYINRYEQKTEQRWYDRYTPYLLMSQYVDADNPAEQREVARASALRLKNKFKFDLAMYTAKSQLSKFSQDRVPENPTGLGDEVLHLIKIIGMRRGMFGYANLANIFLKQTHGIRYQNFKQSLRQYILFGLSSSDTITMVQAHLDKKLNDLYANYHGQPINDALLLRTCNRVIEYLTTEDRETPAPLFRILLSQRNPLPLVSILLKMVLICRNSRAHLEARIGDLIHYYKDNSDEDCQWVVNFFEVFNVVFIIHTENVEYSVVHAQGNSTENSPASSLEAYRIFPQLKTGS